jgi:alkylation response protein AidB-like acyl-CoA dehydrogenase
VPASFRDEARGWLAEHLRGEFAAARGAGGPGREHEAFDVRLRWERLLGAAGWTCLGWPVEHGGRGATIDQQVAFHEEYVRADAPVRVGHVGEGLLGPTVIAHGTPEQRRRFLPPIVRGEELWCQGYSEPDAGSDLANVATRAELVGDEWVVTGQKVWTSLAHVADWCFVLARTEPGSARHHGLSYLLVPMRQPGVEVRPIRQLTGGSEFNEVFFDGARTPAGNVVGGAGNGWRIALATLGYERGTATLGQQLGFRRELTRIIRTARENGAAGDPLLRDRLTQAWIGLELLRLNALRALAGDAATTSLTKLSWSHWHRDLGELAMDIAGPAGPLTAAGPAGPLTAAGDEPTDAQRLFLFSRADTIYAGSSEIQRTIIAERVLGLPRG